MNRFNYDCGTGVELRVRADLNPQYTRVWLMRTLIKWIPYIFVLTSTKEKYSNLHDKRVGSISGNHGDMAVMHITCVAGWGGLTEWSRHVVVCHTQASAGRAICDAWTEMYRVMFSNIIVQIQSWIPFFLPLTIVCWYEASVLMTISRTFNWALKQNAGCPTTCAKSV